MKWLPLLFVVTLLHGGLGRNLAGNRRQTSSSGGTSGYIFNPTNMGSMSGAGAMNPFATQTHASGSSSSSSSSSSSGNNINSNPMSGSSGMPNPFNPQASSGQQSTSGYSGAGNPAGNPMLSGYPMNSGSMSGAGAINPFATQTQMNQAGGGSSSTSSSSSSFKNSTNSNPMSGSSGMPNPFNPQASSGQQSTAGYVGTGNPAGNPMQSGNPMNMNPFGSSSNATSNSSSQSTASFPLNPFGSNQMSSTGFSTSFDPNKINGMTFSSLVGRMALVKRQTSGGSATIPKYDPNAVNQLISSFLDPSKSKLGAGGATGGMYNPDQWNTISFNMFNPQFQLGRRRLTRQTTIPKYDPNAVNQLTSSFLDPSKSKLGAGGVTGGMYNPDQWNTISFNMFNPQSQLGRRHVKRQTAKIPSSGGSTSPSSGMASGGTPSGGSSSSGSSSGGSPSSGSGSSGSSQTGGATQLTQPNMFINPGAFMMGGGSPSSPGSGGGSSSSGGSSSGGSGSSGSSSSGLIPSFDPNKLNQIQASFLDPSNAQLGQGGGGGSGFNPDQINSQAFNFFNPNLMMGGGGR